ncbi:sulfide:quinone oxidoreductase, mitochondrial [Centruroides vittatus]|uniref:sulfide:quinone oxidoreductase, mitochondrial n=1 Tax=Centruroides vittatus TaxID=120091 RepID=UPI00350FD455
MKPFMKKEFLKVPKIFQHCFSTSVIQNEKFSYHLLIIGGGTGGISIAAKFGSKLGKDKVAIIEPSNVHYYQPYWTLVGGGLKNVEKSRKDMSSVIPKNVKWIKDLAVKFEPDKNTIFTEKHQVEYDFLIISMGIIPNFKKIKGLPEAFQSPGICSNYSYNTVTKTPKAVKAFHSGNAIFTQPPNPIKCAGAPQKILYLTDSNFRKMGKRERANLHFCTALDKMFSAPKYCAILEEIAKDRNINVHFHHNLIEIKPQSKEAVFEKLNSKESPKETTTMKYEMIHIVPPMSPHESLRNSKLVDSTGFLDVNKYTLQHNKYSNIFGLGDCTNVPTSKTAAAVAAQVGILKNNMIAVMEGKSLPRKYDGYSSCPLLTSLNRCVLAEFDYDLQPLETFPFDQGKERRSMFHLKKDLMPELYWKFFLKGYWEGPHFLRKLFHFGMSK